MKTLALKRRRDIMRQKWQFIAVLVTVVLGVSMFAGAYNAYLNLGASLDGSYDRLGMADMTVTGADPTFAETASGIHGVSTVSERRLADVPFEIGDYSFLGRIVGYPAPDEPELNRIDIDEGAGLDPDDLSGVLLETHAASDFDVSVGDTISIAGSEATVVGIVTSTEYLWPARDRQNIFTPPKSFGVAFVNDQLLESVDGPGVSNQVLVGYDDDSDVTEVNEAVEHAAEAAAATDVETLEDQPSNATINLEIDGLRTMAVALPLLFLAAAGMAIYVVITRLVWSQRGVIGTLRASGFSAATMSNHYRIYGLSVGVVGAAVGAVLGSFLARGMTAVYTAIFGIPDLVAKFHLPTVLMALAFGAIAGVLAAVPPARTVARLEPAEAMRGDAPPTGGKRSIFETLIPPLRNAPVRWRMSLRGIGRNKKRSTSMVGGVVLGMILILASWGMMDTMLSAMDRQFNEIAVEDASVVFAVPVGDAQIDAVEAVDNVRHAEPVIGLQATFVNGEDRYVTLLEGYQADTEVHGFPDGLPSDGLLLGQAMENLLDIAEGDSLTVELAGIEAPVNTTVAGFIDEPLGTVAYMNAGALTGSITEANPSVTAEALSHPSFTTAKALFSSGADSATVVKSVRDLQDVAAVVDSSEIRDMVDDFQLFFYAFIGMMLVFGGAMAFALIFNIISVNVTERSGEFASMRANGLTHRRVASLIMGETFLLTTLGIVPGLIAGYIAATAFMKSFSSDQFPITTNLSWYTYVGSAAAMFVVAGLSLIPALRSVRRINVGEIVRERST